MSGVRLQDHWSSDFVMVRSLLSDSAVFCMFDCFGNFVLSNYVYGHKLV